MILWRASVRYLTRHPLQLLFAVVGVALGVAVVVAIDLANSSAERAFRQSAATLSGRASHQVVGLNGVPEEVYRQLRLSGHWRATAPLVEGFVTVAGQPGQSLRVLGVDPFAETPFRNYSPALDRPTAVTRLLSEPGSILLSPATATRLGLDVGAVLTVDVAGVPHALTLIGLLDPPDPVTAAALENLLLLDIAAAQELLGLQGRLSRIELILPDGAAGTERLRALEALLPVNLEVIRADNREGSMATMTRAFQLNLTALSLLALVVGMFLIYNTMTFLVLQRRPLLGTLRTLGVTRRELFRLILTEALVIGSLGTLLGLVVGMLLANGLLALVTRTISDLYFDLQVRRPTLSLVALGKGLLLGVGATLLAALVPALEAARATPRTVLDRTSIEGRQRRLLPWALACGSLLIVSALAGLLLPGRSLPGAFVLMFVLILGYGLVTPGAAVVLLTRLQPLIRAGFGILGKMAARNLIAGLSRTGVATAALVIAVAATIGVGLMIGSFRVSVEQWLHSYLHADIYLSTPDGGYGSRRPVLSAELLAAVRELPGISQITRARHLRLETAEGFSELFVAEIPRGGFTGYWFAEGDNEEIYEEFIHTDAVIVSEPYAYHRQLQRGDVIELRTDSGERPFRIAGIFTDYGSDQGRITMSRQVYEQHWQDPQVDALGLYLSDPAASEQVAEQVRAAAAGLQPVIVYSNRALREASLATFDRTFAVTAVLRLLALLVAFVGILNALMAMQIERSHELAVLRANGLTPQQLWGLVIGETGLIGLLAGLLALPLGILQALVLILVINRRSFGWSMQVAIDPLILLQAFGLALLAALLAGVYPAWRMARTAPALALRRDA